MNIETRLQEWQGFQYEPKHIWFRGAGGDKVGMYYVRALAMRCKGELKEPRLCHFDFKPHQQQTSLYVSNFLNEKGLPDVSKIPMELVTALIAYVRLYLDFPQDWKAGSKFIHCTVPAWGTFYLEQAPALIPKQYQELLLLPELEFCQTVTHTHPLFSLLNNETKGFNALLTD